MESLSLPVLVSGPAILGAAFGLALLTLALLLAAARSKPSEPRTLPQAEIDRATALMSAATEALGAQTPAYLTLARALSLPQDGDDIGACLRHAGEVRKAGADLEIQLLRDAGCAFHDLGEASFQLDRSASAMVASNKAAMAIWDLLASDHARTADPKLTPRWEQFSSTLDELEQAAQADLEQVGAAREALARLSARSRAQVRPRRISRLSPAAGRTRPAH